MSDEVRLWRVGSGDSLRELVPAPLDLEARLEAWLDHDIAVLSPDLLVIGRQVKTDFRGVIDLLCLDQNGDLVVVELKKHKTPREITAQVLDYGSWIKDLSDERIKAISDKHLGQGKLDEAFNIQFDTDLPETLNDNHRLLIVASQIDPSSERIIRYLSDSYGVNINAVTFQYFKEQDGSEFIARVFLIDPAMVEEQSRTKGSSKRHNLTPEELKKVAEEKGVQELYSDALAKLQGLFLFQTYRTGIGINFTVPLNGRRKTVISLIPEESDQSKGLRFHMFSGRLCTWLNLQENALMAMLPQSRETWFAFGKTDPDHRGFEGFFANTTELDRFIEGLKRSHQKSSFEAQ
jgi:hypothetical protein